MISRITLDKSCCRTFVFLLAVSLLRLPSSSDAWSTTTTTTTAAFSSVTTGRRALPVMRMLQDDSSDDNSSNSNNKKFVTSRQPHEIYDGGDSATSRKRRGTFLGFRNTKDLPIEQQEILRKRTATASSSASSSALQSVAQPLMPDGGLSPCVIRVLGVGGGGCNAVRISLLLLRLMSFILDCILRLSSYLCGRSVDRNPSLTYSFPLLS